ncbi:hypothetical protein [Streptomyces sp. ISL-99]|uniref:hypothetical protein n=1 Tax=Streptomyces sp. ISL-99 TaxID=2819193 RepID=UPI002035150A|nr:hypothetical protein [Streptomyces sp. ISL-99]
MHGQLAGVQLDGDVVLLGPGQVDLDEVGVVGLLQVGQRRPRVTEQATRVSSTGAR